MIDAASPRCPLSIAVKSQPESNPIGIVAHIEMTAAVVNGITSPMMLETNSGDNRVAMINNGSSNAPRPNNTKGLIAALILPPT
jgi:hypothetical protein